MVLAGMCTLNPSIHFYYCMSLLYRCDDGFSGSQCQLTVSVPSFKEDFESTLQANRWPVTSGGLIAAASVASGNALVFSKVSLLNIVE